MTNQMQGLNRRWLLPCTGARYSVPVLALNRAPLHRNTVLDAAVARAISGKHVYWLQEVQVPPCWLRRDDRWCLAVAEAVQQFFRDSRREAQAASAR